ncbi:hypothetical protein [Pseudomonas sp. AN-1]|uniref:hypothetical protein n=1 Tax=Pseudomonas sp. AN-1 TaxID=3096605 RepID=UPI002A6ABFB9|nr:hypothetical protein [Pseudomonas sp. AN-1]WPP47122.1 hypothetical protein SK095_06955 [Pseudomonas sp. AN-1]
MTRKDLIDEITHVLKVTGTPISKVQVTAVLDGLASITTRELMANRVMHLPRIGGLQPVSGQQGERNGVMFHPWPALDDALNLNP